EGIVGKCDGLGRALAPRFAPGDRDALLEAAPKAAKALDSYRDWLREGRPTMAGVVPIGKEKYDWMLRRILMMPFASDELVAMATEDWRRAEVFEAYENHRNAATAALSIAASIEEQQRRAVEADDKVRRFLVERHILDVPDWMPRFRLAPLPDYLDVFSFGAEIQMFSPSDPTADFVRFIRPPTPDLGFWGRILATDPRPVVVHEGIPGHAFHLRLIDRHPNPIRRHHYDGGLVEGIGTYVEEMLLQQGLFDDEPELRRAIYQMLKLRALRVILDVNVSTGRFSIEDGARFLSANVPMDYPTAFEEANWAAATPGQNATYFAGKAAIMRLLVQTRQAEGDRFDLHDFHTRLWGAGGVPATLLRWEWLGQDADVRGLW
ncbi:MAG: DUF885 family protein, partial [Acidobacteria bacterium]